MAAFNGRRAPNFSQYLDDLNAIPSPYDQALQQQQQQQTTLNLDEELALFTNTEFFDFDKFNDLSLPNFDSVDDKNIGETDQNADMKFLDFLQDGLGNMPEYQPDFSSVNAQQMPVQNQPFSTAPSVPAANPAPVQTQPPLNVPQVSPTPVASAVSPTTSTAGPKRKHTQKSTQASAEEAARNAAEEDKRRRNTAASARFRVKKKMREQALEKSLKETNDKNDALEARVSQLELENHWLRGLIMEKNGTQERDEQSEKAISDMFKNYLASQNTDSSTSESKHGVGTFA